MYVWSRPNESIDVLLQPAKKKPQMVPQSYVIS